MPMADEACLSAVTILSAPISRASERRVELTPDQFFDEPSHPIAHTALDRIKPVIEKVGRSLVSRREKSVPVVTLIMALVSVPALQRRVIRG